MDAPAIALEQHDTASHASSLLMQHAEMILRNSVTSDHSPENFLPMRKIGSA
jgi:hypothetical protein